MSNDQRLAARSRKESSHWKLKIPCWILDIDLPGPATYHRPAMTRPQIEFSIKVFIVLLIIAFGGALTYVLRTLGWA